MQARHRVNVGRPLPPLVKLAAEPKEPQFHGKPRQFLVAASADDSTPVSSSSASSANSSKDEMSDQPGVCLHTRMYAGVYIIYIYVYLYAVLFCIGTAGRRTGTFFKL